VLPAYRRAFLIQKSAGGGLSYKVKNLFSPKNPRGKEMRGHFTVLLIF